MSSALSELREFWRDRVRPECEDFIWMVPQHALGKASPQPVAAVRITGRTLRIECPNRHTFAAMQILVDCLVGEEIADKAPGVSRMISGATP